MLRYTAINGTQSIEELCEHCGEKVSDVHISDIISKRNWQTDMTFTIKDASNADYVVKTRDTRVAEIKTARFNDGMLSASSGVTESLKYGLRSERMCSSSTSADEEFCYRTTNTKFLAKYSTEWEAADRVTQTDGLKLGVGRTGTIKRIKSESISGATKYHGPWKQSWFRELRDREQEEEIAIEKESEIEDLDNIEDYESKADWDEAAESGD